MRPAENDFHVVFGTSAQKMLGEALRAAGCDECVVAYPDDLSVGPIAGEDAAARVAWMMREFGPPSACLSNLPAELAEFWCAFRLAGALPIIWFTRRSAREYSGFLEFATVLDERHYRIIDFTGADFVKRRHEGSGKLSIYLDFGEMMPSEAAGYFDSKTTLSSSQRDHYRQIWNGLRGENAPLRVLADGGLASAPISFFDDVLLAKTKFTWQKIARTIGGVWGLSFEDHLFQISELVLVGRIRALVSVGLLESRGDLNDIRAAEIRRIQASPTSAPSG